MELQERFLRLFKGYPHAKGAYRPGQANTKGKVAGKAVTVIAPLSEYDWKLHLDGADPGLGVIPLDENNCCSWAAIDVDILNINHAEVERNVTRLQLPLTVFRSKSGGAHLIVFFKEPAPAEGVLELLQAWASLLGFGLSEIFPKQIYRANDSDIGNWLNMPYYGGSGTLRYAILNGVPLSPQAFLDLAESRRVLLSELNIPEAATDLFVEGPPCLRMVESQGGFGEGVRNEGMFSVGVYLRKRFPDDWENRLAEYAPAMTNPPIKLSEINVIIKSINRKDYQYKCKSPSLRPFCNRTECMKLEFGVGSAGGQEDAPIYMEQLVRLLGDEILWLVQVDGRRLILTTDELWSPIAFVKKVAEVTGNPPDPMPLARWQRYIAKATRESKAEQPPVEEISLVGAFKYFLDRFLTGNARCMVKEELLTRDAPWYDNEAGVIRFQQLSLTSYFKAQGYQDFGSSQRIGLLLREAYPNALPAQIWLGGSAKRLWAIPLADLPGSEKQGGEKQDEQTAAEDF